MPKTKSIDPTELQHQHKLIYPKFEMLCVELVRQIEHLVTNENIKLAVPLQYRAKKWESIYNKVSEGRFNVKKDIKELQDLAGLRVITLFQRDALKISDLIEQRFRLIKMYRTEEKLNDDQFGYSSIHMIIELPSEWQSVPTLSELVGMKVEIQIRTLSQHSWAEASKVLQYKQEENVPKPLKRSIGRISALLETVDLELERLLDNRETYITSIQQNVNTTDKLNVDLLSQILSITLPKDNFDKEDSYADLLEELVLLDIDTSDKLLSIINKHLIVTLEKDKQRVSEFDNEEADKLQFFTTEEEATERLNRGVFYTHSGLVRTMLTEEFSSIWREKVKKKQKEMKI